MHVLEEDIVELGTLLLSEVDFTLGTVLERERKRFNAFGGKEILQRLHCFDESIALPTNTSHNECVLTRPFKQIITLQDSLSGRFPLSVGESARGQRKGNENKWLGDSLNPFLISRSVIKLANDVTLCSHVLLSI